MQPPYAHLLEGGCTVQPPTTLEVSYLMTPCARVRLRGLYGTNPCARSGDGVEPLNPLIVCGEASHNK